MAWEVPQECIVELREQHASLNRSLFLCFYGQLSVLDTYSETNNPNINGGRSAALKGLADGDGEKFSDCGKASFPLFSSLQTPLKQT